MNRTLSNGMRMLEIMSSSMREYSVVELARSMDIPKSHSHRLLQTLVELGYVHRSTRTRKYSVDVRLLELASAIARGHPLRNRAGTVLRRLAEETRGTSVLSVWNRDRPLTVMSDAYSGRRDRPFYEFGERLSLTSTATGKVFCAFLEISSAIESSDVPSERSNVDAESFRTDLAQVCSRGYAVSNEEERTGVIAVAAPVWTRSGELEAVVGVAVDDRSPRSGGEETVTAPDRTETADRNRVADAASPESALTTMRTSPIIEAVRRAAESLSAGSPDGAVSTAAER